MIAFCGGIRQVEWEFCGIRSLTAREGNSDCEPASVRRSALRELPLPDGRASDTVVTCTLMLAGLSLVAQSKPK